MSATRQHSTGRKNRTDIFTPHWFFGLQNLRAAEEHRLVCQCRQCYRGVGIVTIVNHSWGKHCSQ